MLHDHIPNSSEVNLKFGLSTSCSEPQSFFSYFTPSSSVTNGYGFRSFDPLGNIDSVNRSWAQGGGSTGAALRLLFNGRSLALG